MRQTSFASVEYAGRKRQTRREKFLGEMERLVPGAQLIALIEPQYPTSGRVGRPPVGVPRMLRMYFLQQWCSLSDEDLEDTIYDSQALRDFIGIDLSREQVPDATTLLKLRRKLEDHQLTRAIFEQVNAHLGQRGLLMREGTLVHATTIAAPPSTKNKERVRDPEMHQTKKANEWHFGMKEHIVDFSGADDPAHWTPIRAEAHGICKGVAFIEGVEPPSWVIGDIVRDTGYPAICIGRRGICKLCAWCCSRTCKQVWASSPGRAILPQDDASRTS